MNLQERRQVEVAAPAPQGEGGGPIRVLAVDDSPFSRKLLEHALRGQAYDLKFAKNGQEALAAIVGFRPKIVITDWMLPGFVGSGAVPEDPERVEDGIYVRNSTYEQRGEREHCRRPGGRRG